MNALLSHMLPVLLGFFLKGSLLLLAAWATCLILRRAAAATRHLVWAAALGSVLLLPLLSVSLPHWNLIWSHAAAPSALATVPPAPVSLPDTALDSAVGSHALPPVSLPPQATETNSASAAAPPSAAPPKTSPPSLVPLVCTAIGCAVWSVGFLVVLGQFLVGLRRIGQIEKGAMSLSGAARVTAEEARQRLGVRPVTFLRATEGSGVAVPVTWGLFRPTVLLPAQSASWSEECLHAALLHEIAHIQRLDWLTQGAVRLACAFYWWHPLVWFAARQVRAESERACDDLVLGTGMKAVDYAQRLVEIVRSMPKGARSQTVAIAMAQPLEVESRVKAVLDAGRSRRRLTRRQLALTLMAVVVLLLPLSALRPVAHAQTAESISASGGQTVTRRQQRGILEFVYLKDVATDTHPGRPWTLTTSNEGRHGFVTRFSDMRTGKSFRDARQIQIAFTELLNQGWKPRPGTEPYLVPLSLSAGLPTRRVFFTPDQRQQATNLETEKKAWTHLIQNSPLIITDADLEPRTTASLNSQTPPIPVINIYYTPKGAKKMAAFSGAHQGEIMGIIVDDGLLTAPMIRAAFSDEGQISGGFHTLADAQALAARLNASAAKESVTQDISQAISPDGQIAVEKVSLARGYQETLPNGYTIGIVGVTRAMPLGNGAGTFSGPFWGPDGTPLPSPMAKWGDNQEGPWSNQDRNVLALRLSLTLMHGGLAAPITDVSTYYQVISADGRAKFIVGLPFIRNDQWNKGVVLPAFFPPEAHACSIRYGVAAGPWRTVATRSAHFTAETGSVSIKLGDNPNIAYQTKDTNRIERTDDFLGTSGHLGNVARRVVIVADSGRQTPLLAGFTGGRIPLVNLTFRKGSLIAGYPMATLTHVKEFLLQTRPYQIVEFRNIQLQPKPVPSAASATATANIADWKSNTKEVTAEDQRAPKAFRDAYNSGEGRMDILNIPRTWQADKSSYHSALHIVSVNISGRHALVTTKQVDSVTATDPKTGQRHEATAEATVEGSWDRKPQGWIARSFRCMSLTDKIDGTQLTGPTKDFKFLHSQNNMVALASLLSVLEKRQQKLRTQR